MFLMINLRESVVFIGTICKKIQLTDEQIQKKERKNLLPPELTE